MCRSTGSPACCRVLSTASGRGELTRASTVGEPVMTAAARDVVTAARKVVIKIGSSSLTRPEGGLDQNNINALATALVGRLRTGTSCVLVSSGAIAAGLRPLGLSARPRDLATQQAAASVGQGLLVESYARA